MILTDSQRNLLSQALVLAADKYVNFAVDAIAIPGGERLQQQFLKQASDTRFMAIMVGDATSVEVSADWEGEHRQDAARITNQQFADTINERMKVSA